MCQQGDVRGGLYPFILLQSVVVSTLLVLVALLTVQTALAQEFSAASLGDFGNVTVMEVTGDYAARLADGTSNAEPRQIIAREFYRTHRDEYDFLIIFTNFDFKMPTTETVGFYHGVKNDIQGLGQDIFDNSALYSSNGKLQGTVDMGNLASKGINPLEPAYERTLDVLNHELLHRWGAHATFRDAEGNISNGLLGRDNAHWSYLLDTKGSLHYGNQWLDNGDGTFTSVAARKYYSPLDLYLMGMIGKEQVPPMLLVENPEIDPTRVSSGGDTISGTAQTITIEQIVAAMGERVPGVEDAPKSYSAAFIFATSPGTFDASELLGIENVRNGFLTRFSILTDGQGLVQVAAKPLDDLPTNPGISPVDGTPRTVPPRLEEGIAWLIENQQTDGKWLDSVETVERDTAEAVAALKLFVEGELQAQSGLDWLTGVSAVNTDYLARQIDVLQGAGRETTTLVDELLSRQNSDGGWGSSRNFISNPDDTALALAGLATVGYGVVAVTDPATIYLQQQQNFDGGWCSAGETSLVQPTSHALLALSNYRNSLTTEEPLQRAADWLISKQNIDGGFGNSPSTVYDSAAAIMALTETGFNRQAAGDGIEYLLSRQSVDGSWNASSYQTAAAVRAVWAGTIDPDLSVTTEEILFIPRQIRALPAKQVVVATVRNHGRTEVSQVKVALYAGEPSTENLVEEQLVSVAGLASSTVVFRTMVTDASDHPCTLVVDPDNLIVESVETNNLASKILTSKATFDFQIVPENLTLSRTEVVLSETVFLSATVTNRGTRDAVGVSVRLLLDGDPPRLLDSTPVDIPAGGSTIVQFSWPADQVGPDLPLLFVVDPDNQFEETARWNNEAGIALTVQATPAKADLLITPVDLTFVPEQIKSLPTRTEIRVRVHNVGRTDVAQVRVVLYRGDSADNNPIAEQLVDIAYESDVLVSFNEMIERSGDHWFTLVVDPDDRITEWREDNNRAMNLLGSRPTYELSVLTETLQIVPDLPTAYQTANLSARILNQGTLDASNVQVRFAFVANGTEFDIATLMVDVPAGQSTDVTLPWIPQISGSSLNLSVNVDPFNLFDEIDEGNNLASRSLEVLGSPLPDLQLDYRNLQIEPAPALEGGVAKISLNVLNRGAAADAVKVDFYLGVPDQGGRLLGSRILDQIGTEERVMVSLDWIDIAEVGKRLIYVQVDPENLIEEISEENNDAFVQFDILSLPDLVIKPTSISLSPALPKDGEQVEISIEVLNLGEQSLEAVSVRLLENETVIGEQFLPEVAGNSSASARFSYDTTGREGLRQITVVVDGDNLHLEQSEENNQAQYRFAVQNADLWVSQQYLSPNGDNVQEDTEFFFRLNEPSTVRVSIVNGEGQLIRNFSDGTLVETTGGSIVWDGFSSAGMVVADDEYSIQLWGQGNVLLGQIPVVVDNNRSTFVDAIASESFLTANLTCSLPDMEVPQWFQDESAVLFDLPSGSEELSKGLYTMSGYGADLFSILPQAWMKSENTLIAAYKLSPDGEKLAVLLEQYNSSARRTDSFELWILDRDGGNLKKLDTLQGFNARNKGDLFWSPDSETIAYTAGQTNFSIYAIAVDGSGRRLIDTVRGSYWYLFGGIQWSPNGQAIVYQNLYDGIYRNDLSGQKMRLASLWSRTTHMEWLNDEQIVYSQGTCSGIYCSTDFWNIDASGVGNNLKLSDRGELFVRHPTEESVVFVSSEDKTYLKQVDASGAVTTLHATANMLEYGEDDDYDDRLSILDVSWSQDGSKLAFVDLPHEEVQSCTYQGSLVVIDSSSGEKNFYPVSTPAGLCGKRIDYGDTYQIGSLRWLRDGVHLALGDQLGTFIINSETGKQTYLPTDFDDQPASYASLKEVSPFGNYLFFSKAVPVSSPCYGSGYRDLWSLSSALNLVTDLRVRQDRSAVVLEGVAADLNFAGYRLEYAEEATPDLWTPISPPSASPVLGEIFTTWVPPQEGTYLVRLTVWDRAGNLAISRKRVAWGLSLGVTGFYKTEEIISPNGDGVKDGMELHYRVLTPGHLEFEVVDSFGRTHRTLAKDYIVPGVDFIYWDGRDDSGQLVPDGDYRIRIFDYEFFVEVDNTPPMAGLYVSPLKLMDSNSALSYLAFPHVVKVATYVEFSGLAYDQNFEQWRVEIGNNGNPTNWRSLFSDERLLVERIKQGENLIDSLVKTEIGIDIFPETSGKVYRLSASDLVGNRANESYISPSQEIKLLQWDDAPAFEFPKGPFKPIRKSIPGHLTRGGEHHVLGFETVRADFSELVLQYRHNGDWYDAPASVSSQVGTLVFNWELLDSFAVFGAIRVHGVDPAGRDYFSNVVEIVQGIVIGAGCPQLDQWPKLNLELNIDEDAAEITLKHRNKGQTGFVTYKNIYGRDIVPGKRVIDLPPPDSPFLVGSKVEILVELRTGSGKMYFGRVSIPDDRCSSSNANANAFSLGMKPAYSFDKSCGVGSGRIEIRPTVVKEVNNRPPKNPPPYVLYEFRAAGYVPLSITYFHMIDERWKLLESFDLKSAREMPSIDLQTAVQPEGSYPIKAVLSFLDMEGVKGEFVAVNSYVVDRFPPQVEINYPTAASGKICSVSGQGGDGLPLGVAVEGLVSDDRELSGYQLSYGAGKYPSSWEKIDVEDGLVAGQLGVWKTHDLRGENYTLKLSGQDLYGNESCTTNSVMLDTSVDLVGMWLDKKLFSPNADGKNDEITINYQINETVVVDLGIFKLIEKGPGNYHTTGSAIRSLVVQLQHIGGGNRLTWDGFDDFGGLVADGLYGVLLQAVDGCGHVGERLVPLVVDNTPPQVEISYPLPGVTLGTIVEVRGSVRDPHFGGFVLEVGEGEVPETWIEISSGDQVQENSVLGTWNTYGLKGIWSLRLTGVDRVDNTAVTTMSVDLSARYTPIKDLRAEPALFSPNGDGALDLSTIYLELTDEREVELQFLDANGVVVRTFAPLLFAAGTHQFVWDGKDEVGDQVADGIYTLRVSAVLTGSPDLTQTEELTLWVDTLAPAIDIKQPLDAAYFNSRDLAVVGTLTDLSPFAYTLTYINTEEEAILDQGKGDRVDHLFGTLTDLAETGHSLIIAASDQAENSIELRRTFTIDRTPPEVGITSPASGSFWGGSRSELVITAELVEANLEGFSLSFGGGENPTEWTELSAGTDWPSAPELFTWNLGAASGLADGIYTIALLAQDKAEQETKALVQIQVDNTLPELAFSSLNDGGYIREPLIIEGTASDRNFEQATLALAAGPCAEAFQWSPLATLSTSVRDGELWSWQALPANGSYCLRLEGLDKNENRSELLLDLRVDTEPPQAPQLSGQSEERSNVLLEWSAAPEPDLAGYNLYRNEQQLNKDLLIDLSYLDSGLGEGGYGYQLTAVDLAGNESDLSNRVELSIDLTGPEVRIVAPKDGALVNDLVEIMGTAFSEDDFREYRLSVRPTNDSDAWQLIRRSPLSTRYGLLGTWDALGQMEGKYILKLEAEDLAGNMVVQKLSVELDLTPPAAPELVSAVANSADVLLEWNAGDSSDKVGYLLYRNDRLVNVSGLVVGDLRPYLLNGNTFLDQGVPDGAYSYYVLAMDLAGNISLPSNRRELLIDIRPPHAQIVEPADDQEFDQRLDLVAETPDQDIASLQFQYRSAGAMEWIDLEGPFPAAPYVVPFDPVQLDLTLGEYELRALTIDKGGRIDPAPGIVTVVFTDITAPQAPSALIERTNAATVTLSWDGNTEEDLAGYQVYWRKASSWGWSGWVRLNASLLVDNGYVDAALADGDYEYRVSAVDLSGNESAFAPEVSARIYAPQLVQPFTPVSDVDAVVGGNNAVSLALVEFYCQTTTGMRLVGSVQADDRGSFLLENLLLDLGENRITAIATDAEGNISRVSEVATVFRDVPPSPPRGLAGEAVGFDVALSWQMNLEADLAGYNIYRDGQRINLPIPVDSVTISATYTSWQYPLSNTRDGDSTTYWRSYRWGEFRPVWFELGMTAPELVHAIEIDWYPSAYSGRDFEVLAWSGEVWVPLLTIIGNEQDSNRLVFERPYRTDRIRISITDSNDSGFNNRFHAGIGEIRLFKETLISNPSFEDQDLGNHEYRYNVSAVDYFGFESSLSDDLVIGLGDWLPPSPPGRPTISTPPEGRSLQLEWSSSDGKSSSFNLYRTTVSGGSYQRVNSTPIDQLNYLDTGLTNGTQFFYVVSALDSYANEGGRSLEASGIPVDQLAPGAPTLFYPTTPAQEKVVTERWSKIIGSAEPGSLVELLTDGTSRGGTKSTILPEITTTSFDFENYVGQLSPEGRYYAYRDQTSYLNSRLLVRELATGITNVAGNNVDSYVWAPDESKIVYYYGADSGDWRLGVYDLGSDEYFSLTNDSGAYEDYPSLSGDGSLISYISDVGGDEDVWVKDLTTGTKTQLSDGLEVETTAFSPDGTKVAYYDDDDYILYVADLETGTTIEVDDDPYWRGFAWSPDSKKLAFLTDDRRNVFVYTAETGGKNQILSTSYLKYDLSWSPDGTRIAFKQYETDGSRSLHSIDLQGQESLLIEGLETLNFFRWQKTGEIVYIDNDGSELKLLRLPGYFEFSGVELHPGENQFYASATDEAGNQGPSSESIAIIYDTSRLPDPSVLSEDISIYPLLPQPGETVAINVTVHNLSETSVDNVDADIYLWAASGELVPLDSRTITHLEAQGSTTLASSFVASGLESDYSIMVLLDPAGLHDELSESNNYATRDVHILPDAGIQLSTRLDSAEYVSGQPVFIDVDLLNGGHTREATLLVAVEDVFGTQVAIIGTTELSLPYGTEEGSFQGNTGDWFAGSYVVHSVLYDAQGVLAEDSQPFTILPDRVVTLSVTTDRINYDSAEHVFLESGIENSGQNHILPQLLLRTTILDVHQTVVFSSDKTINNLLPGVQNTLTDSWNTEQVSPGSYHTLVEAFIDEELLASASSTFVVNPVIKLAGSVSVDPQSVVSGVDIKVPFSVRNSGNRSATGQVRLSLFDPEKVDVVASQEQTVTIPVGGDISGQFDFATTLLGLKSYRVLMHFVDVDGEQLIAEAAFAVVDGHPPVVTIQSPGHNETYRQTVDFEVVAQDDVSGVDSVSYRLDAGEWQRMPFADLAADRYRVNWQPTLADNGFHAIEFMAIDHAGNRTQTDLVSFELQMDITPPVTLLEVGQPHYIGNENDEYLTGNSRLNLFATDDISGVAGTEYRFDFGDWVSYDDSISLIRLPDGEHVIGYRSVDLLGNLETEKTLLVTIDNTSPVTDLSIGTPQYTGDSLYVTGETEFTLTSSDNLAGVLNSEYRIDDGVWATYAPFTLADLTDGIHTISYRSEDALGNLESEQVLSLTLDNTAPVSSIAVDSPQHTVARLLYVTAATGITLSGEDNLSGVVTTEYRIDGGAWAAYAPFTLAVLSDGEHAIGYRSTDNLGNLEAERTLSVIVDNTAPVTEVATGTPRATGSDGTLYVSGATELTLTATDNLSEVAATEYRVDGGAWTVYAAFTLSGLADGAHNITYRSVDSLGNLEEIRTLFVVVDDTAPMTEVATGTPQATGSDGTLYVSGATEFTLTATDNLSGVATTEYRIDGGAWAAYVPFTLVSLPDGEHAISYRSTDNLSNLEAGQTLSVIIDNTAPVTEITTGTPQFTGSEGKLYVSDATEFTLTATDNLSEVAATEYRIDGGIWTVYAAFTLSGLADGAHNITYRSVDSLGSLEEARILSVVVDNTAPVTEIATGTPQFTATDGTLYVSGATEFTLTAIENLSGVATTEYRVGGGAWTAYAPFNLNGSAEGDVVIDFRSTDNLSNLEIEQSLNVVVDNTPPVTSIAFNHQSYMNVDQLLVSGSTQVLLSALDSLAGVAGISYRFDEQADWQEYSGVFSLAALDFGTHIIHFRSVDHVLNMKNENSVEFVLIGVESTTRVLNVPRVLVWLGEEEKEHKEEKGHKEDKDHDHHGDDKGRDDDHESNSSRQDALDFLTEAFAGQDVYSQVVTSEAAYERAFRSGVFNLTLILDGKLPFNGDFVTEFAAGIRRGMGLLFAPGKHDGDWRFEELLGVKYKGRESNKMDRLHLQLYESALSTAGEVALSGPVLKTELAGGKLAALIPGERQPESIERMTLSLPEELHDGDTVKASLLRRQDNRRELVDEEWLTLEESEKHRVNQNIGNVYGDLSLRRDDDELELQIASNFGAFEGVYELDISLIRHDDGKTIPLVAGLTLDWETNWHVGAPIGNCQVTRINDQSKGKNKDLPGVVLHPFGEGRTAFLAFDLIASARIADRSIYLTLLQNALNYLLSNPSAPEAASTELLETAIKLSGSRMDLVTIEHLWPGLTYKPLFNHRQDPLEYHLSLQGEDEARYRYFVQSEDRSGTFGKETEVLFFLDGIATTYESYPYSFVIEKDSGRLLQDSIDWLDDMILLYPAETGRDDEDQDHDEKHHGKDHEDDRDNHNCFRELKEQLIKINLMSKDDAKRLDKVIDKVLHALSKIDKLPVDSSELRSWMSNYLRIMEAGYDTSGGYVNKRASR